MESSIIVWFAFESEAFATVIGIFSQRNRNELPGGALNKTVAKCDLMKKSEKVTKNQIFKFDPQTKEFR